MKHALLLFTFLVSATWVHAESVSKTLSKLIHPDLREISAPKNSDDVSLYEIDLDYQSEDAYTAIQQGFGHLLSISDFQAYRFFLEALKREESSIMASSGLTLSLLSGEQHLIPQCNAAIRHLTNLLEKEGGTKFERDFGIAVLGLSRDGTTGWNRILNQLRQSDNKGHQIAKLLHAYYLRDGYNADGTPKENQQKSVKILEELRNANPTDPATLVFYITAQMDNPRPNTKSDLAVLPAAKELVTLHPNFPAYQKLYAFCVLRYGDPFTAASAYHTGSTQFQSFVSSENIPLRYCIDLVNCQIGTISALILQENYTAAQVETDKLLKLKQESYSTPALVNSAIQWEAASFPLRIALLSENNDMLSSVVKELEVTLKNIPADKRKLYHDYWETLLIYAKCREMISLKATDSLPQEITRYSEFLSNLRESYIQASDLNAILYWKRACNTLNVLHYDLLARYELTKTEPDLDTFSKLITKAIDLQQFHHRFMPPVWPNPVDTLKTQYLIDTEHYQQALVVADSAYRKVPNHPKPLRQLHETLTKLKRTEDALKVKQVLKAIQQKHKAYEEVISKW